jgi:hypothetical protein
VSQVSLRRQACSAGGFASVTGSLTGSTVGSADALRTGTYAKPLTFTLSTTTP